MGFYSEWSPGISTHRIKILTADKEHKVEGDGEGEIELPRLREVGDWSLDIVRKPPCGLSLSYPLWMGAWTRLPSWSFPHRGCR